MGIRVNTLKADVKTVLAEIPGEPTPFAADGFYLAGSRQGLGRHPFHHAGAFYVQEPSAMSAVTVLAPQPGDRVLDLCAAPGGKSTQIAAALQGKGFLVSNEYVATRAKILASNLERMGVANSVVLNVRPDVLCSALPEFFDKVLVDAPCSGEGMFRKEPEALANWNLANVQACADRQLKILNSAVEALRPGGLLCYSTCTFSPEEDEGVVAAFLAAHPDFRLVETGENFGCAGFPQLGGGVPELAKTRRIFPFHGGEGHFVALFQKAGEAEPVPIATPHNRPPAEFVAFWQETMEIPLPENIFCFGSYVALVPSLPELGKLRPIKSGILAGKVARGRFIPAHALFASAAYPPKRSLDLPLEDPRLMAFLHGEEIPAPELEKGIAAVRVCGVPLGFGKVSNAVLKNHYPKGLRLL